MLKNVWVQSVQRDVAYGDGIINVGHYLQILKDISLPEKIKPVCRLSDKPANPSNWDKMNVRNATQVYSGPTIAALQTIIENPDSHAAGGQL